VYTKKAGHNITTQEEHPIHHASCPIVSINLLQNSQITVKVLYEIKIV